MGYDWDSDTLLLGVEQVGDIACHKRERSCFHMVDGQVVKPLADMLSQLFEVVGHRRAHPQEGSVIVDARYYSGRLYFRTGRETFTSSGSWLV